MQGMTMYGVLSYSVKLNDRNNKAEIIQEVTPVIKVCFILLIPTFVFSKI